MLEGLLNIIQKRPLVLVGSLIPLIPLFFGIFRYRFLTKSSKAFLVFIVIYILSDIPLWITASLKIHNYIFSFLRDSFLLIFLSFIYFIGLKSLKQRRILIGVVGMMFGVVLIQILNVAQIGDYLWVNRLFLVGISLAFFFNLLDEAKVKDIITFPFFWFNSGILIFCSSSLMITLLYKFTINVLKNDPSKILFLNILEIISSTMFIFIAIGFWMTKKNRINIK